MFRNWFSTKRNQTVRDRYQFNPSRNKGDLVRFEQLEDRRMLAFVGFFNGVTLDLVQTFDHGDVVIDNSGIGGGFRVTDNAGSLTFVDAENVTVSMLDNTANQLNFNINSSHTGDVGLFLGDGPRDIIFGGNGIPGIANVTGGNMTVTAGAGPQFFNLAPNTLAPIPFQTVGSASFDLGTGFDTIYNNENFVIIGGDLDLTGVNLFRYTDFLFPVPLDADLQVGGNMTMDTSNESIESFLLEGGTFFDIDPNTIEDRSTIAGNFTYIGGDDIDHVDLLDTYIMGDMIIDLGEGIPFFGDPQNVTTNFVLPRILGGPYGEIDGNIDITAGASNLGNTIDLDGYFNGNTVNITTGDLDDTVIYSLIGTQADVTASLGGGDDTWILNRAPNIMDIDFGNDAGDQLINNYGKFTFDSDISNFHWFNHFYTVGDDTLELTQLIDTGNIIIDNDGGPASGVDWRVFTEISGPGATTTASNLILNMLTNTNNTVTMDLINPVIASITMNLEDGDRLIEFVGSSNNPLRDINITADLGEQIVELSVNAPLAVATLNVDLGRGYDTVDDDFNNLILSEDLVLRGVNLFENDGVLTVARNVILDSIGEVEDTIFATNDTFFVGGSVTYIGGDGRDEIRLNGSNFTSIGGNVMLDMGGNVVGGTQLVLLDGPTTSIGGFLNVISTSVFPDIFTTSATIFMGGNIGIDLGHGMNDALIIGSFGGSSISYDGGNGVDTVILGTTGNDANVTVNLGQGDDVFTLMNGTAVGPDLFIDFGDNNDTFNNLYGPFDFNAALLGINGFDHAYDLFSDTLNSTQVSDHGNVTIDNNGVGDGIRFINGGTTNITPVTHMNVTMQNGSSSNVNMRLDNAFAGDLTLNLGSGNRLLNFDGTNNSIGGNLVVTGNSGNQNIELAVNNALSVTGDALVSLDIGTDSVDEDGNDINIGGQLDLIGVNAFTNNGILNVTGNVTFDVSGEDTFSFFNDDGGMNLDNNFTYFGGDSLDTVALNGPLGTTINGSVSIALGDNTSGGTQTANLDSASLIVGSHVSVSSTSEVNPDSVNFSPFASIGGNISVDLAGGMNTANLVGVLGGFSVIYIGGDGVDDVTIGTTGSPANFDIALGQGDDILTLLGGTQIAPNTLSVNFGDNDDTFNNLYGAFDFGFSFFGLDGFDHIFDLPSSTLTSTQISDHGHVNVDNDGVGGAIQFTNGDVNVFVPVDNLNINMLDNSLNDLNISLDNPLSGNLTVDLGDGERNLNLDGTDNSIGGDLVINGGEGVQTVEVAVTNDLNVGGHMAVDLGNGKDIVDEDGNNVSVASDLHFTGVNTFDNEGVLTVGGEVVVDNSLESEASNFNDNNEMNIGGGFTYLGGDSRDRVTLDGPGGSSVGGDFFVDLGDNTFTGTQLVSTNSASTSIGGHVTALSTAAANPDSFLSAPAATIGGDIIVDYGNGQNNATLRGVVGGSLVKYTGGIGNDIVTFGTTGNPVKVNAKLGAGDDSFTLDAGADIGPLLRVDFGGDVDLFHNNFGAFTFNTSLLNWQGFNRFFYIADASINFVQVADTGDITIDNNGTGNAVRLINAGIASEMTPVDNIRMVLMDNTSTNVHVDTDSALAGNLILQLSNGSRNANFIGDSNTFGGFVRVEASEGVQDVNLADNADLTVGDTLIVNGRNGSDSVSNGGHNITVGTNMILRGVNTFDNTHDLTIGGNLNMITSLENEDTRLSNNGSMTIGGNITYIGGNGLDDVLLGTGNVSVGDTFFVNLATSDSGEVQTINLSNGFFAGRIAVTGGNAIAGNEFITDALTSVAGDVTVNFTDTHTVNTAVLLGTYGGTYGTYRGGFNVDTVTFGATASSMEFVALLSNHDDVFTLKATADLASLLIDFGNGADNFDDEIGAPYPFATTLLNL